MVNGEGGLPILGVVLEPILFRQDCICIVVQAVLIVHKAGHAGEVSSFIGSNILIKPVGILDVLFHE